MHREGDPTGVLPAIPTQGSVVVSERITVDSAQAPVDPLIAIAVVVTGLEDELCVDQLVVTIVAEHDIVPEVVQQAYISQVDDVVCITVDLIAIVVQIVERDVKERSEVQAQNPVDDGSTCVGIPASGNYRAIPYERCGTIGSCGRRKGTAPVVMSVVPTELVVVVVAGVVEVVVV